MESRDATFFESEFPMNGNAPSTSGHESSVSPDTFVQIEQTTIVDPEKDDNRVTQKSKRQRVAKFYGDDFAMYLVDDTQKPLMRHIPLTLTLGRKRCGVRWILLWSMKPGKLSSAELWCLPAAAGLVTRIFVFCKSIHDPWATTNKSIHRNVILDG
jgi:hypothetical protein